MHTLTSKDKLSRLLRLTPLIIVIAGSVLTLVGNTASLKSCKIAGPVLVAVGGLLLLSISIWSSRQDKIIENTICEEAVIAAERLANRTALRAGSNDQLGPIHHFEVKTPSELSWKEMVPPSYEEAIDNYSIGNLQTRTQVVPSSAKESSLENATSAPPSYEESQENGNRASMAPQNYNK